MRRRQYISCHRLIDKNPRLYAGLSRRQDDKKEESDERMLPNLEIGEERNA